MSVSALTARSREPEAAPVRRIPDSPRRSKPEASQHPSEAAEASIIELGGATRVSFMLTPREGGSTGHQARELMDRLGELLKNQPARMTVTAQTVFLRDAADQAECERILSAHYGENFPAIHYVLQPPCCGAAIATEAWAIGGRAVQVERFGPHVLALGYDGIRWVHCTGITSANESGGAYEQMTSLLERMRAALAAAGADFEQVVRTWFYLGKITELEHGEQRYKEMNRARADFYRDIAFGRRLLGGKAVPGIYPASTGIGVSGRGLAGSCLALQTSRPDATLLNLENPCQTPAYAYPPRYSPRSPKFSRGMALVLGNCLTTWVSGTASIVNSESRYPGDITRQTEQTIDNIEQLLAPETFAWQGQHGVSVSLHDLAKIRVYVKRPEDFPKCKAVCERRFGRVPAIYAVADVCRPELLVEIEGVAFSRRTPNGQHAETNGG